MSMAKFTVAVDLDKMLAPGLFKPVELTIYFRLASQFGLSFTESRQSLAKVARVSTKTVDKFLARHNGKTLFIQKQYDEHGGNLASKYVLNAEYIRVTPKVSDGQG